ncbi:MAG: class I SAM-dependent methyltransferase [Methanobacterium sp.]|nr:class I SAM-dependent methyltransferase [Methanobacterium sp.]
MKYKGIEFQTCDNVYEPAEDTFLLGDNLIVHQSDSVLEIGTGTGIIAILASKNACKVTAVDINKYAVECAIINNKNNAANIDIRLGDLFEPVKNEKFDLILFNTPYLPTSKEEFVDDELEAAWNGGEDGRYVINRFIKGLPLHLNPYGRVQLVQSSLSNVEETVKMLNILGFEVSISAREKFFFEEIVVITGQLI